MASKLEKLHLAYDNSHSKKELSQPTSHYAAKKGSKADRDIIEGNFVVPDVFMKTKYGPTTTYNYNIRNNEQPNGERNFGEPHGTGYKASEKHEPKKVVTTVIKQKPKISQNGYGAHDTPHDESRGSPYTFLLKKTQAAPGSVKKKTKLDNSQLMNDLVESSVDFNKTNTMRQTKTKMSKNTKTAGLGVHHVQHTGDEDNEFMRHDLNTPQIEGGELYQPGGQLPYLNSRYNTDKTTPNAFESTTANLQKTVGMIKAKPSYPSQANHGNTQSGHAWIADDGGDPGAGKHYNIVYNNNTYNYNVTNSPGLKGSYMKKKL